MKIYVAASFPRIVEARNMALYLMGEDHKITSTWLDQEGADQHAGKDARKLAIRDEDEIREADCVVMLAGDDLTSGGRHVELGMAIILGIPIFLIGRDRLLFQDHPLVMHVEPEDLIAALATFTEQV